MEAIEAIATHDAARALEAAGIELTATGKTADEICRLVVRLDVPAKTEWLAGTACKVDADRHGAIGRALRKLPGEHVATALEKLLQSELRTERLIALKLASWTTFPSNERIHDVAEHDPEGKVRDAAASALAFRRRLTNGVTLLRSIVGEPEPVQWSHLHALIWSVHPSLLTDREDELWIGHALDSMPPRFAHFAKQQIERRKKKTDE